MNLRKGFLSFSIFSLLIFTGLIVAQEKKPGPDAPSQRYLEEAKAAVDKGNKLWIEAWEKGDAAMVASIFTEDGMILGSKGRTYKGHQQIRDVQQAYMKAVGPGVKVTVTTTSFWVDGETAFETGKYAYDYTEDGKPARDEGRYATVWKRQKDGTWKLALDMSVP